MADKKITQLTNITGANLVDADEFVVVDISADETKAITLGELKEAFDSGSGFVRITGDTMTGPLDVQSTITSDGLTVDGVNDIVFSSGGNNVRSDGTLQIQADADGSGTGVLRLRTKSKTRQQIDNNGDISFYEDTGTTAKFFWDASAESLGIGTSSPSSKLHLSAAANTSKITISSTDYANINEITAGLGNLSIFANTTTVLGAAYRYLNFGVGTTEAMRIDSSGNVGIGTDSPSSALHLKVASPVLTIQDADGVGAAATPFIIGSDSAGLTQWRVGNLSSGTSDLYIDSGNASGTRFISGVSERMRIGSNGNVGIGTSSPSQALDVRASSANNYQLRLGVNTSDTPTYDIGRNFSDGLLYFYGNQSSYTGYVFSGINGERMRIDSSGNVGIGTSSPARPLDVNGSMRIASGGVIEWGGTVTNFITGNNSSNYLALGTNSTERMRIDSSGNVGIGTSSPSASINKFIQVYQPSTGNAGIKLNAGSTTGFDFIQNQLGESFIYNRDNSYLAFGTNNSERMRLDSSGNLLVGKTSFDATATGSILSNNGELWVTRSDSTPVYIRRLSTDGTLIQFNKDGTTVGSIGVQSSADLTIGSGTSGFSFSSAGNAIVPNNPATNTYRDAAINLGYSGGRFKDGYFSGTVNAASFSGDGSNLTGISGTSGTPAGAVIYHAGSTPPTGFIKANGASLSTTTYADLFAAIGYTYGGSGGSFNVPDLRGEFLRGWDDARGVDSGRTLGSAQADELRSHSHAANVFDEGYSGGGGQGDHWHSSISNKSNTTTIQATGGNETRPRNIALLACIKY